MTWTSNQVLYYITILRLSMQLSLKLCVDKACGLHHKLSPSLDAKRDMRHACQPKKVHLSLQRSLRLTSFAMFDLPYLIMNTCSCMSRTCMSGSRLASGVSWSPNLGHILCFRLIFSYLEARLRGLVCVACLGSRSWLCTPDGFYIFANTYCYTPPL